MPRYYCTDGGAEVRLRGEQMEKIKPAETGQKPARGRPAEMAGGKRRNVYLDDDGAAIAMELGSGNISEGIRIALAMASTMEHVDDLAMLVRRLAHALRKSDPDNPISDDATEYLKRHGLAGSPLR